MIMPKSQLVLLLILLGATKCTTLITPTSISRATSRSVYQNAVIQCTATSTIPGTVTVDWSTTALSADISKQIANNLGFFVSEALYLINVDGGYCGVYTCHIADADMIPVNASTFLTIAPIIKTPLTNKVYILSPSLRVTFTCTVDGGVNNHSVEILWSGPVDLPDAMVMEISSGVFTSSLTLTNVTTNFSGIYECTTRYNNSLCTTNSSSSANLALLGPPTLTHRTESPLRVNCGDNNATLNFEFSGLPSHNDVQYKCIGPQGANIETDDDFTFGITLDRMDNETELQILRLNINIVYINHVRGGMYSCTASNSAGNTTATVLLQVLQSERSVFWFQLRLTAISNCNDWIREDMDLKLQDLKQQASNEITAGCDRCDQSIISIREGVFRCFPGSESAVTYRALLHENCKISSIELQLAIERWLSSGRAIVVQSLVLKADSSCPVIVGHVNDPECAAGDPNSGMTSNGIPVSIIVGGVSGAFLGTVLLVGIMITVTIIATFKHRQTIAKLMGSEARGLETVQQHTHTSYNQQPQPESALASAPEDTDGGDPIVYEDCSFYQLSPCPAYESVPHTTSNQ